MAELTPKTINELTPKTINELPETTAPTDETLFPVSKGGSSFRLAWSAIKEKIFSAVMALRGGVPNGTDINTVITPGVYVIASASTYTNLPAGVQYGTLHVFRGASTSTIITQILVTTRGRQYNRIQTNGSWSAWVDASMPSVLPVSKGGTDATTTAGARENLGLVGQLAAISVSNGATKALNVPNNARFVLFLNGQTSAAKRTLTVFCTSGGTVSFRDDYTGAATTLTISSAANTLTIANTTGAAVYGEVLAFGTSAVPSEVTT